MSKDHKDLKGRAETLRQLQRKDSLTSLLSWTAGRTGIGIPVARPSTAPASYSPSSTNANPPESGSFNSNHNNSKQRRHSHSGHTNSSGSFTIDVKKKARIESGTVRLLASINPAFQQRPSAKTRPAKTSPVVSLKEDNNSDKMSVKTAIKSDSEKGSAPSAGARRPNTPVRYKYPHHSPQRPKSILRNPKPDVSKRPRTPSASSSSEEPGQTTPPLSPSSSTTTSSDAPATPPLSPSLNNKFPQSQTQNKTPREPTVRFAKATIHHIEVYSPGAKLLPVKRKSRSTLSYLDPSWRSLPKNLTQNPVKWRRHQENQKAMGRYWRRTEEEEQMWRREMERRAEEEARAYRSEPAARPGSPELNIWVNGGKLASAVVDDKWPLASETEEEELREQDEEKDKLEEVLAEDEDEVDKLEEVLAEEEKTRGPEQSLDEKKQEDEVSGTKSKSQTDEQTQPTQQHKPQAAPTLDHPTNSYLPLTEPPQLSSPTSEHQQHSTSPSSPSSTESTSPPPNWNPSSTPLKINPFSKPSDERLPLLERRASAPALTALRTSSSRYRSLSRSPARMERTHMGMASPVLKPIAMSVPVPTGTTITTTTSANGVTTTTVTYPTITTTTAGSTYTTTMTVGPAAPSAGPAVYGPGALLSQELIPSPSVSPISSPTLGPIPGSPMLGPMAGLNLNGSASASGSGLNMASPRMHLRKSRLRNAITAKL